MNSLLKVLILICSISVILLSLSTVSFAAMKIELDDEYTVTTSAGPGGTITDSYTYTVDEDYTEHEIVYSADPGYYIKSVIINGEAKTLSDDAGIAEERGVYCFT